MRETLLRMWMQIRDWFAAMPRNRKIQLAVLSVFIIVLAIVVVNLLTRTNWVRLPITDRTTAPAIYTALNEMGIPNRALPGDIIEVPEDRLGEVQMRLREQNLLGTADFPNLYLDDATGFGITDQHARELYSRQRAEEIKVQLMQHPRVTNALVIVNLGDTSVFRIQTNTRQASASIMLTLSGTDRLTRSETQAIGEIVRGSVSGIEYENISITDHLYRYYSLTGESGEDMEEMLAHRRVEQNRLTEMLQKQVHELLSPVYGYNNIQVQPNVDLNWDNIVTESVEFEPPIPGEMEGIVRSLSEIHEQSRRWMNAEGVPGTDTNNMGTVEYPWGPFDDEDMYRRSVMERNMEINETRQRIEHALGTMDRLSIAILINSEIEGIDQEYTDEVIDLVAKAIGVSTGNISVQHMPFSFIDTTLADMYEDWQAQQAAARNRALLETIMMYVVILLLGIMIMLLVRTIVKAVKPPPEPEPVLAAAGPEGIDLMIGDDTEQMEYEDVDLQQKSAGLEQIERFIDKDSASVAQLLRNWLSDE
ncbi:MAG: flagellar M-ring protein FliF [Oscillospiraceae bacterium]|nr:flagellar M-ring protein FliF [Oscillospiraceae bacterium]